MADSGDGQPQFMSHAFVFHHSKKFYHSDSLALRISYEDTDPPYQIAPVTFKLTHFSKWLESNEIWYSSPFFTFNGGYQVHLRVYSAGVNGEGTHVSVYLLLTKGPHDDKLEQSGHWPLRGTFTIELLNQLNDSDHHSCMVQFHHHLCSECTNRVLEGVVANSGLGQQQFISHDALHNNGYMKNNFLFFRISYESVEPPYQIMPVTFKLSKFSQRVKNGKEWYSSPFFAFNGGYQMILKVDIASNGDGEGTHVSVYLYLMKGPHDDKLEQSGHWPLRGTFTIELLNQLNPFSDSGHLSDKVQFHHHFCTKCTERVVEGAMANSGRGHRHFISHDNLLHRSNNAYYRNDSLIFRISYEVAEAPYQVAPVTFKLTHFSKWLESKNVWFSSPFFAFDGGYQMHLHVTAAGADGTHVSVYLDLTPGPHDDKLEQSGHWPLRGTFTIELLNQLNDSDHHSRMIQIHHYQCSECTNRVLKQVMANSGRGEPQFISYDILLDHTNKRYYQNDALIFRICYENVEPPHQVAPVTFKLSKFSQWVKSKEVWLSNTFFAFEEGYQIFLSIKAAGHDEDRAYVSAFLYLTSGPHDDKLEQSGHWPLKGIFTIELLNQLNDSDHYSPTTTYIPSGNGNRIYGNERVAVEAVSQFISHITLYEHNGYLMNDTVYFRISYYPNNDGTKGHFITY